jgi:hypothetical protein
MNEVTYMQWFMVTMSGCEQGPGDPCFFDDDPLRVYLADEADARIAELERKVAELQHGYEVVYMKLMRYEMPGDVFKAEFPVRASDSANEGQ